MNERRANFILLISSAIFYLFASTRAQSQTNNLNRFSLVGRAVFNIEGGFKDVGSLALGTVGQTTPDGTPYNYDDGYVLTDVSGNAGGQTWNWGYNNSSQISGNTILMHQTTALGSTATGADALPTGPGFGFELVYNRQLGRHEKFSYGVEVAMNYLHVSLDGNRQSSADISQTTDTYSFTPGTTPPSAPYQGTFDGPGFLINASPISSVTGPGTAAITGSQQLDANIWGWRLGPYLDFPVTERVQLSLSAGLAMALFDVSGSWAETTTITGQGPASSSGAGSDTSFQWGAYVGLNAAWQFAPLWSAVVGVQYQYLDVYEDTLGGRAVELDLNQSVGVTFGVSYSF